MLGRRTLCLSSIADAAISQAARRKFRGRVFLHSHFKSTAHELQFRISFNSLDSVSGKSIRSAKMNQFHGLSPEGVLVCLVISQSRA